MATSEKSRLSQFISREFWISTPAIIPAVISGIIYHPEYCCLDLFKQLEVRIADRIFESSPKRQADYLAGRLSARNAIYKHCSDSSKLPVECQIDADGSRMPIFPDGFVGSISHTGNTAIAAVTNCKMIRSIGIDIEHLIPEDSYHIIKQQILTKAELSLLSSSAMPKNEALTVIFSAKESLYKLLYPIVRRYFDFSVAKVNAIETAQQGWSTFTIQLIDSLGHDFQEGAVFYGFYQKYQGCFLTLLALHNKDLVRNS